MIYNDPALWPRKSKEQYDPFITFCSPNTFAISATHQGWDGTLEYSWDKTDWTTWDGSSVVAEFPDDLYALYFRGTGNTHISPSWGWGQWTIIGEDVRCIGNIETLLDYSTVVAGEHPPMAENCYHSMFDSCSSLTQAPALPAVRLTDNCYAFMFKDCTSLIQSPALPATTLAYYCYAYMFQNCTSLITAPSLPATTLAYDCYNNMFLCCKSLTQVPSLPATTLADYCYEHMFDSCVNIKVSETQSGEYTQPYRIPTSGTGNTAPNSFLGMFHGTGGTFTGSPEINTTYYLSSSNTIV